MQKHREDNAMQDEIIRRCILEFRDIGIPDFIPREVDVPILKNMVTTIVGARKVGKTYLTYQLIDQFIRQKHIPSLKHVCYLHFDDERLLEMQLPDLRRIDQIFLELSSASPKDKLLFVFDEIHRIPDWEFFALRLNRNPNWHVIVTGSSADLEEDKVGKQLKGKTFTTRLYPLSFREFLRFSTEDVPRKKSLSTSDAAQLSRNFREYMKTGSYPAVHEVRPENHRDLLRQYFNSIVASDFVDNRDVRHPLSCKIYLRNLLQRNACPYTHKKERNILASMGHAMSPTTITDWFSGAVESYFIGVSTINSPSVKKQEQNYRKIYAVDWALANAVNAFGDRRTPHALEAIIYWHLQRMGFLTPYALVGSDKQEVDFVAGLPDQLPSLAVQVCMDVSAPDVLDRESRALDGFVAAMDVEPLILTLDDPPSGLSSKYPIEKAYEWCLRATGAG
ncbi:ATP-binding protein [Verrucomicrobiota bacterium]